MSVSGWNHLYENSSATLRCEEEVRWMDGSGFGSHLSSEPELDPKHLKIVDGAKSRSEKLPHRTQATSKMLSSDQS
jgi:hypothetical protein